MTKEIRYPIYIYTKLVLFYDDLILIFVDLLSLRTMFQVNRR